MGSAQEGCELARAADGAAADACTSGRQDGEPMASFVVLVGAVAMLGDTCMEACTYDSVGMLAAAYQTDRRIQLLARRVTQAPAR